MMRIEQLSCGYDTVLLDDINLTVEEGEMIALMGRNASGKTTLLRTIAGTLPKKSGRIYLDDTRLDLLSQKARAQLVSYLPQRCQCPLDITTEQLVIMGVNPSLMGLGTPTIHHLETARELLSFVGLSQQSDKRFKTLSEGQKQLAFIARLLMNNSAILLLDEPDSALDFPHKYQLFGNLKKISFQQKKSIICSVHDPNIALEYFDRIVIIENNSIRNFFVPATSTLEQINKTFSRLYTETYTASHGIN